MFSHDGGRSSDTATGILWMAGSVNRNLTFIYLRWMKKLIFAVFILFINLPVFSQNIFYYKGYTLRLLHPMNFNPLNDSVVFNSSHDTVFIYHLGTSAERLLSPTHTLATVSENGVADIKYNLRYFYYIWSYHDGNGNVSGENEMESEKYPTKNEILNLLPEDIRKRNPGIEIYEKISEQIH
jgi:hypothetical protein